MTYFLLNTKSIMDLNESLFINNGISIGDHNTLHNKWYDEHKLIINDDLLPYLDKIKTGYSIFFKNAVNIEWKKLTTEQKEEIINKLKNSPQSVQRSAEWYLQYSSVLTASEFSSIFGSPRKRGDLIMSKVFPKNMSRTHACKTIDMSPMSWGIRFEPVVKQIFEYKYKCSIYELGRIIHETNNSLAASPDGIIVSSESKEALCRLIEIKCPFSREITNEIPFEYWVQMQIQMEVTGIDECEYIEVNIQSIKPKNLELDIKDKNLLYYGYVYLLLNKENNEYKYIYGDINTETEAIIPD